MCAALCLGVCLLMLMLLVWMEGNISHSRKIASSLCLSGLPAQAKVVKLNWATAAVKHFFPEANETDKTYMVDCLMGKSQIQRDLETHSEEVAKVTKTIMGKDLTEAAEFTDIHEAAGNIAKEKEFKQRLEAHRGFTHCLNLCL